MLWAWRSRSFLGKWDRLFATLFVIASYGIGRRKLPCELSFQNACKFGTLLSLWYQNMPFSTLFVKASYGIRRRELPCDTVVPKCLQYLERYCHIGIKICPSPPCL